jgi:hypothetical protein
MPDTPDEFNRVLLSQLPPTRDLPGPNLLDADAFQYFETVFTNTKQPTERCVSAPSASCKEIVRGICGLKFQ